MADTKLKKILKDREISNRGLIKLMKSKGVAYTLTVSQINRIVNGKSGVTTTLVSRKKTYPSTLERLCIALDCKSSDLLDF